MLEISIARSGQFTVNWSGSNAAQCGLGPNTLNYHVRIVGDDEHLTPEGFIIDNNDIHAYFVNKYADVKDFESCERIAITACKDFCAMLGERARDIQVTIDGNPLAGLTARWTA